MKIQLAQKIIIDDDISFEGGSTGDIRMSRWGGDEHVVDFSREAAAALRDWLTETLK